MKSPDAILCADNHFRDDAPVCRTDDFFEAQFTKLHQIASLANGSPILCAGDLLDYWKISHALEARLIGELPQPWLTVPGQHELPSHRLPWLNRSALWVLHQARAVEVMRGGDSRDFAWGTVYGMGWGEDPRGIVPKDRPGRHVLLWHRMVWNKAPPFPGADPQGEALRLLKSLPQFDLIVTGDNHQPFEVEHKGRRLINPGPMTRQRTIERDIAPRVYEWFSKDNTWKVSKFTVDPEVISIAHLSKQVRRDSLGTFAEKLLATSEDDGLDFEHNLRVYLADHHQTPAVEDLIWRLIE